MTKGITTLSLILVLAVSLFAAANFVFPSAAQQTTQTSGKISAAFALPDDGATTETPGTIIETPVVTNDVVQNDVMEVNQDPSSGPAHISTVSVTPNLVAKLRTNTFTATVSNDPTSTANINEVRIYNHTDDVTNPNDFTNFLCLPKAGWYGPDSGITSGVAYCLYRTISVNDEIIPGSSTIFEFNATSPETDSCRSWKFDTRANDKTWNPPTFPVCVDAKKPITTQTFTGPYVNRDGVEWIDGVSQVVLKASDPDPHPSNVNKTYYRITTPAESACWNEASCVPCTDAGTTTDTLFFDDFASNLNKWSVSNSFDVWRENDHARTGGGYYVSIQDDATITATINTTDYSNIKFSYYRRTHDVSSGDKLRVYWRIDSGTWTELEAANGDTWINKTWNLAGAENKPVIQIKFFLDDDNGDYGYVDDVKVTGDKTLSCPAMQEYTAAPISGIEESCHMIEYYSTDFIGNKETPKQNCFFVDKTKPESNAYIDGANKPGDGFTWITQNTKVNFTCNDVGPHPSHGEKVCYKVFLTDVEPTDITANNCPTILNETGYCCTSATLAAPYAFKFKEDSNHRIHYYCMDAVEKKNDVKTLTYKVDSTAPTISKDMIGTYAGDCPSGTDLSHGDCYVKDDGKSGVHVSAVDGGAICAVDQVQCSYKVWWHTDASSCAHLDKQYTDGRCLLESGSFAGADGKDIILTKDSTHDLEVSCSDALDNTVTDTETFLVDGKPPETTKTYGTPSYSCGDAWTQTCIQQCSSTDVLGSSPEGCVNSCLMSHCPGGKDIGGHWMPSWITSQTPITLNTTDNKVGVDKIYYRYMLVSDNGVCNNEKYRLTTAEVVDGVLCEENPKCTPAYYSNKIIDDTGILTSTDNVSFTMPQDSCHVIEYYSVDKFGNEEKLKWQCVFVDNKAPITTPAVGNPNVPTLGASDVCGNGIGYSIPATDSSGHCTTADCCSWYQTAHVHDLGQVLNPGLVYMQYEAGQGGTCSDTAKFYYSADNATWTQFYHTNVVSNDWHVYDTTQSVPEPFRYIKIEIPNCYNDFSSAAYVLNYYVNQNTDITLTCNDQQPHPVDHSKITCDYTYSPDCDKTGADWSGWTPCVDSFKETDALISTGESIIKLIHFPEDSCHKVRYSCEDALGNNETQHYDFYYVDTQAPSITTRIDGPSYNCNQDYKHDDSLQPVPTECFIDGKTKIHVEATDPTPHPVDNVTCKWYYTVNNGGAFYIDSENVKKEGESPYGAPVFDINFPEESHHILAVTCKDALGNTNTSITEYSVDKTSPLTSLKYGSPFVNNGTSDFITSQTAITIRAFDDGDHKSGVNKTYYRVTMMPNETCSTQDLCEQSEGAGSWIDTKPTYDGDYYYSVDSFTIKEDSCHLIEYYSVDNVEKNESELRETHKQCVYVDNQGPEPVKTVGQPSYKWDGKDAKFYPEIKNLCWNGQNTSIDCWNVTVLTPITLDCNDTQPHPVGGSKVQFKVELDGDDATQHYCTDEKIGLDGDYNPDTGYCQLDSAPVAFFFAEESEHNLNYRCVDALGNIGKNDDEKFKVRGTVFNITINKKWNLISTPFTLLSDSMHSVFDAHNDLIISITTYDPTNVTCGQPWCIFTPDGTENSLTKMVPGAGYWLLAKNNTELQIGGSLFSPAIYPPEKQLTTGWNLIGYYGLSKNENGDPIVPAAYTGPHHKGRRATCALGSLVDTTMGYPKWTSLVSYWEENDPKWIEFYVNQNSNPRLDPGAGYWIFMNAPSLYAPSTVCQAFD